VFVRHRRCGYSLISGLLEAEVKFCVALMKIR